MKIPEKAPRIELGAGFSADPAGMVARLEGVLDRAQSDYLHWDRFKHLPMPEDVKVSEAWALVKLMRGLNRRATTIPSAGGERFSYCLTQDMLRVLHLVDRWAANSDRDVSPDLMSTAHEEYHVVRMLIDESIASSQIEGASTTRRRAREMLLNAQKPRDRSERMILNNYRTMKRLRNLADSPITPELLLELQASMTAGTLRHDADVGVFRTTDDVVVADDAGAILYVPPEATAIPQMVNALCEYANEQGNRFEHPVVKAITLHFWLALIHPFADGNGRTARALFYLSMIKSHYRLFEYLSVSSVIVCRRAQYERAYLYSENDDADLTYFIQFHLRAIETALGETWRSVQERQAQDAEIRGRIGGESGLNYRQREVLTRSLRRPEVTFTIQSHASSHGVVRATARTDLLELCDRGLLVSEKDGRQIVFFAASDLRQRLSGSAR